MTMGITIFGTIQNNLFTNRLAENFKGMGGGANSAMANVGSPQEIFQSANRAKIPAEVLNNIVDAMSHSISRVFLFALIPIAIAAVVVASMGNARVTVGKEQKAASAKQQKTV